MKITKSRLLEIIKEEVKLHQERNKNSYTLDEESLMNILLSEKADKNGDGKISKKEAEAVFKKEKEKDKEAGNLNEEGCDVEEDALFTTDKPHKKIEPEHSRKIEVKLRK